MRLLSTMTPSSRDSVTCLVSSWTIISRQLRFVKHKNHENARKQRERTLSVRTLGPCGAATAKKKNLLHPSSFLLRRSPSKVRSIMPLHRLLIGLYDYQACSVGLKMDVYMHRRQESRSQSTVNRSTEFEVTTSLRRNTVCTSVIVWCKTS